MEISVEPSKTYAVTTSGSCTVTDADGLELCTASSGSQAFFVATTPTVTISDDGAKVSRATFNYALAVAGLLGGGADKLPAGYTRVEYISPTKSGQNIQTDIFDIRPYTVVMDVSSPDGGVLMGWRTIYLNESGAVSSFNDQGALITGSGVNRNIENIGATFRVVSTTQAFIADRHLHSFEAATGIYSIDGVAQNNTIMSTRRYEPDYVTPVAFIARNLCYADGSNRKVEGTSVGSKHYSWKILEGDKVRHNWVPALDPTGAPCMFDMVTRKPYYNSGTGDFTYPNMEQRATTYSLRRREYAQMTERGIRRLYHVPRGYNGTPEEYAEENGFKILVETPAPEEGYWAPVWHDREDCIELEWVETEPPIDELSTAE